MVEPLIPEDPGLLASVGRYLGRFAQVPMNLLSGDIGGAFRQGADILGETVDAALPGDWIPQFTRPEDEKRVSKMLGINENDRILAGAADFVGETLLNPLTYLTGGTSAAGKAALKFGVPFTKAAAEIPGSARALEAGGNLLKTGYEALPQGVRQGLQNAKVNVKSTLGWLKPEMPEVAAALEAGDVARQNVTKAGIGEVERIFQGTSPQDRQEVFDILQNVWQSPSGVRGQLAPMETAGFSTPADKLAEFSRRAAMTGRSPEDVARLTALAEQYIPYAQRQWAEGVGEAGIFTKPAGTAKIEVVDQPLDPSFRDLVPDAPTGPTTRTVEQPWEIPGEEMSPGMYAQRTFTDAADADIVSPGAAGTGKQAISERKLKTGQDVVDEVTLGGMARGTELERDLGAVAAKRAEQQGKLAGRAAIAKSLLGDDFVSLADDATRGKVTEILDNLKGVDPEGHRLLTTAWNGMEPRGPIMDMLAKANAVFKPAAVYGLVFPRVGGIMKNILSFPAQLGLAGEGTAAVNQLAKTPATVYEAMRQGTGKAFGLQMPASETGQGIDLIEQAMKQSGGRAKNAEDFLRAQGRDDLAEAVRLGVADGFVSREAVENTIKNSGWGRKIMSAIGMGDKAQAKAFDLIDAPAAAFQGAEQHARIGGFLDMLKRGRPPEEAARAMKEGLYDYSVKTGANRTLRDIIPFAAYQTNAIRQAGKFIGKNPAAGVALGNLSDTDPSAQYEWMSGQTNIPIGTSEKGEAQYLTGLGLPTEALNSIPNISGSLPEIGQELRSNLLGNAHPLLKTGYSVLTGEDPRFGTAYGSYDKLPGNINAGAFGSAYNQLAGTGLIQPLTTPLNQLGQLIDDRTSAGDKALSFLTGTRVVNVDEYRALRQRLQTFLENNPDVSSFQSFFQQNPDPQTQALIKTLQEIKARQKAKREAAQ